MNRDSFSPETFNYAFVLAKTHGIEVAYSNEAFELWYLLHFNYYDTGLSRNQYKAKLSQLLGHEYKKNSPLIFEEIFELQNDAIRNAERLISQYPNPKPENDNPSTTVHILVKELRKWN